MHLEPMPAQAAIGEIMRRTNDRLPVLLCRRWATTLVTVRLSQPGRLDGVLKSIADQLGASVTWYVSQDPTSVGRAAPMFHCPADDAAGYLSLDRTGAWSSL